MLMMGQAGFLDHEETVHGIRTFAREVMPRLKETLRHRVPQRTAA
jgi:hypothetical protein